MLDTNNDTGKDQLICLTYSNQLFLTFRIGELSAARATFNVTTLTKLNGISCDSIGLDLSAGSIISSGQESYLVLNVSKWHAFCVAMNLGVACAELVKDFVNSRLELLVLASPW